MPGTGPAGVYITDDTVSLGTGTVDGPGSDQNSDSVYSQVTVTVNTVQLVDSGTNAACTLPAVPSVIDIAALNGIVELVSGGECGAGPYNRIRITMESSAQLTSRTTGSTFPCSFTSYNENNGEGNGNQPDRLICSDGTCELDINGAVNVLATMGDKLGISIKDFSVKDFGSQSCTVSMKVSPLNASQMKMRGPEAVTGLISGLNTDSDVFSLQRGSNSFVVDYSGIAESPGLEEKLQQALAAGFTVRVISTAGIDLANGSISATSIE